MNDHNSVLTLVRLASRRAWWLGIVTSILFSGCGGTGASATTREHCELLQARSLELRIAHTVEDQATADAHRRQLAATLGSRGIDWCLAELSADQVGCALKAEAHPEFDACLVAEVTDRHETEETP